MCICDMRKKGEIESRAIAYFIDQQTIVLVTETITMNKNSYYDTLSLKQLFEKDIIISSDSIQ